MIGQTVSHYRIIEKLGEGGMGVVYLAEDTVLGRQVAIKTLTDTTGVGTRNFRGRFLREARSASTLSHQHIATIYDYGETPEGQPYIVMEFVKGAILGELIRRENLTIPRSLKIVTEVAEALAEAHRHGIIHRDIKPSNVAINHRGEVKVLDFGLAKQLELGPADSSDPDRQTLLNTQTREGVIVGTPMYLSPEQALGVDVDVRSDLFSLGGVLYECIAGKPPFTGGNPIEICAKVIRDDPPPPSQLNKDVTAELDRITLKALAKKQEHRYQTADEMIADLNQVQVELQSDSSGHPVTRLVASAAPTRSTSALATFSDILKRPRLSIGYVAGGLVLVGLIVTALWWAMRPKPHQATAEAQKWYDIGVNYLREGAYFKAIKPLQESVNADDKFALAHARLAEAWTELDYTERAQIELLRVDGLVPDRSVLERVDLLYLDAIRNTITRDFPAAANGCAEIAKLKPNEAYAYLDVARAYEKNDEIDKALENLKLAAARDAQYAPAFLRLGILYGRKEDLTNADAAFDKADSLFQTLGDFEGRTEVLFQRGAMLSRVGKMPDAQEQLQKALDIARTSANQYQEIKTMLQLSTVLQTRGNTEPAKQMAGDAVNLAQSLGIENLATQGLIDLGDAYLVRREYPDAERVLKQALDFARRNKGRRNEARSLLVLAKLYIQQETNTDEALTYVEQALAYFQQGGYNKEVSLAILLRGRARLLKGDYDGALTDFAQQIEFAQKTNNQSQLASTHLLVGNLLKTLERYSEALISFQKSFEIYKTLDVPITMGYLLVDQSEMLWRLGRYDEAKVLLAQVPKIADRLDSNYRQVVLARQSLVESKIALSEGNSAAAIAAANRALTLAGTAVSHTGAEARCQLGLVETRLGSKTQGLKLSQEAVEMAKLVKDEHLLSSTQLSLAEALLATGDLKNAVANAREAQQRFAQAKQHESEWQAWLLIGQASARQNDSAGARDAARHALGVLTSLEQKWGSEAFQGYASRQDIKAWRMQIEELLTSQ